MKLLKGVELKRQQLRQKFFKGVVFYAPPSRGFFMAPRSLPMLLTLLSTKKVAGTMDPGAVYLELLSRCKGQGLIEMGVERDHAFAAGYFSNRAVRTWRERMAKLEELGLIKSKQRSSMPYGYVLLLPTGPVIQTLKAKGKLPQGWMDTYESRQLDNQEIREFAEADDIETESPSEKKRLKRAPAKA